MRTWYGSSSEDAAWAEFFRHFLEEEIDPFQVVRRIGTIRFEGLVLLDLTDARIRDALGLTGDDLVADDHGVCRLVADQAREAGFDAILGPSAALPGETTLAVFGEALTRCAAAIEDKGRRPPPRRMITVSADFNHRDARGRLILSDLLVHERTPFEEIAARGEPVLFVQEEDVVTGRLVHDPTIGWVGDADWETLDVWEAYPRSAAPSR